MGIIRLLKPVLFIYECIRIALFSFAIAFILPQASAIPWFSFTAAGALFPLMALFLWLDIQRYREYLPLFSAGKAVGIFSLALWSIFFRQFTMTDRASNLFLLIELIFLCGDFFALAVCIFMYKKLKITNKPVMETIAPDTEDKQCE